jgi:hypothetical protein
VLPTGSVVDPDPVESIVIIYPDWYQNPGPADPDPDLYPFPPNVKKKLKTKIVNKNKNFRIWI